MNFLKNILKYAVIVPQIVAAADQIYDYVSQLDDDPEVKQVWETVKDNAVIASRIAVLRSQFELLIALIDEARSK